MNLVPRVWTAAPFAAVRDELHGALHVRIGACPGDDMLAWICSMAAVEHGLHEATAELRRRPDPKLRADVLQLLADNPIDEARPWESFWYLRGVCNFNMGNHDGNAPGAIGIYETIPEREVINGKVVFLRHERAAFASLADGCTAYVWRLAERWPMSFLALSAGVWALAYALKHEKTETGTKSYYTEDEAKYARALEVRRGQYDALFRHEPMADLCGWP